MARFIRGTAWYSISEETLRAMVGFAVFGILLFIGYRAYMEWDEYTLENRATETLNGARSLLETLHSEDAAAGHREYLTRATAEPRGSRGGLGAGFLPVRPLQGADQPRPAARRARLGAEPGPARRGALHLRRR